MKVLKGVFLTLAVLIGALLLVGFLIPSKFRVERSATIAAKPAQIHRLTGDLKAWDAWTTWKISDPSIVVTLGERTTGVGARQTWTGKDGRGEIQFTKSSPKEGVTYDLTLDGKYRSVGTIRCQPEGDSTRVVWTMEGDAGMDIMARYFGLMMDSMVGKDFAAGLVRLGPLAEQEVARDIEAAKRAAMSGDAPDLARLLDPESLTETAPEQFGVKFTTTKGDFIVQVTRDWAPHGADRFYNLVRSGFYDNVRFFRVVPGFMVQFGINGSPDINRAWLMARIPDDPVKQSNTRGFVTFATSGPHSRTTQIFINFVDRNAGLDGQGFSPFGKVSSGMEIVDRINSGYGESPDQGRIQQEGNAYLESAFPELDTVKTARIVPAS